MGWGNQRIWRVGKTELRAIGNELCPRECYLGVKVELCKNMHCQSIRIVITTSSHLATWERALPLRRLELAWTHRHSTPFARFRPQAHHNLALFIPLLFSIKALGGGATRRIQFPKSGHLHTTNTCLHYWTRYLGKVPQLLTLANNVTPPQKKGAHQGTHLNRFTRTSIPPLMALPVKLMVCSTGILASWHQKFNKYLKYSFLRADGKKQQ
jgi:hypothetical protein